MHFAALVQSFLRKHSLSPANMTKKMQLKDKSPVELTKLLSEKREEFRVLRFSAAGARPKDSNAPRKTRKDIARILTERASRTSAT